MYIPSLHTAPFPTRGRQAGDPTALVTAFTEPHEGNDWQFPNPEPCFGNQPHRKKEKSKVGSTWSQCVEGGARDCSGVVGARLTCCPVFQCNTPGIIKLYCVSLFVLKATESNSPNIRYKYTGEQSEIDK